MDEEKKKISFIINPKSGTQCKEQILHLLDEKLDKAKYVQEVIYTEYAGHAVEIAAQKAKGKCACCSGYWPVTARSTK